MPQDFDKHITMRGFHVPPARLEYMSTLANRVVKLMTDASRFTLTLDEVNLTLELAKHTLNLEDGQ